MIYTTATEGSRSKSNSFAWSGILSISINVVFHTVVPGILLSISISLLLIGEVQTLFSILSWNPLLSGD